MPNLGLMTNVEVLHKFVTVQGKTVVDVGCGDMTFSKIVAAAGAQVLAIDPDPVQAEENRAAVSTPNITFAESGADSIPAADQSVDGIFFSYSLHHIPKQLYSEIFEEAIRVLRPDGFIYVIEPTDCPLNQVMMLFHDEEAERSAAQSALHSIAKPRFESAEEVDYHSLRQFQSFDDFADHFASRSFNTLYSEADVRSDDVRKLFEEFGAPDYEFTAPKRVMVLKQVKPTPQ